jgi:flagellar hook-length control protein FliK
MNALPTNLMLAPTPAMPMPGAGALPRDGAEPGFARCLDQATGREAPARDAGSEPNTTDAPTDAPSQDTEAREAAPQNTAAHGARRAPAPRKADAAAKAAVLPATTDASATTPPATAVDDLVAPATATKKADDAAALGELLPGWATAPATPATAAASAQAAPAARPGDATLATGAPGAQAAAIAKTIDTKALKADEPAATAFALPAAPPPPAASAAAADTPPPVHAHVAAAVDSPAFAPALATQVRWLVRDGLQQAQLSLNPAEMGPVTVQIVLDGREARIDFRADLALTRNAIESSLPVLAAALDESGLRLAGGGVHDGQMSQHQHRAMPQDGARPGVAGRGTVALDDETPARTTRAAAGPARGLVDLVA